MKSLQDIVKLPPDKELLDDARQIAVERAFREIRGLPVGVVLTMARGALHEALEGALYELAECWVEEERRAGFDGLAADREEWRDG